MIRIFFEGILLGLSTGIYCVGACLVFFMPYLLVEGAGKVSENLKKVSSFMLGRLIAYIAFALIMSFIGMSYQNMFTARFSYICLILASLLMLVYSLTHNFKNSEFCSYIVKGFSMMRVPFFLGTSVYMIPLVFVSYLNRSERIKHIGLMVALLSSLWFLFVGISGLMR